MLDPLMWAGFEVTPEFWHNIGVCMATDSSLNVLQFALKSRVVIPVWMSHRALVLLKVELPNFRSLFDLRGVELTRALCQNVSRTSPR